MEEEKKRLSLPTKTKIAAWLMRIGGVILFFIGLMESISSIMWSSAGKYPTFYFTISIVPFLFAHFLSKGKKWAWYASVAFLLFLIIFGIYRLNVTFKLYKPEKERERRYPCEEELEEELCDSLRKKTEETYRKAFKGEVIWYIIPFIPPLVFLLFDRKNFWKITT